MSTEALKSTPITNLDALPTVLNDNGKGGPARLQVADASLTGTTGVTSGSTYQLVRVPTTARVKHLNVKLDATVTTFTGDFGLYYSSATNDGTPVGSQGAKVNSNTGGQLFGAAVALASQVTFLDLAQNMSAAKLDKQLWDAAGLTVDPGGYFDIVMTLTATNSGAPVLYAEAQYVVG